MNEFHHTNFEMNQSRSEANLEIEQRCRLMINISVSQRCLTNTRTLICLCKKKRCEFYTTKKQHFTHIQEMQTAFHLIDQLEQCLRAIFNR
jgi:hypothetical protein